jgi:hypothetical protein
MMSYLHVAIDSSVRHEFHVDEVSGVEGMVPVGGGVAVGAGIEVPSCRGTGIAVGRLMNVHGVLTIGQSADSKLHNDLLDPFLGGDFPRAARGR